MQALSKHSFSKDRYGFTQSSNDAKPHAGCLVQAELDGGGRIKWVRVGGEKQRPLGDPGWEFLETRRRDRVAGGGDHSLIAEQEIQCRVLEQ